MSDQQPLADQHAFITGGGSGIGNLGQVVISLLLPLHLSFCSCSSVFGGRCLDRTLLVFLCSFRLLLLLLYR